MAEPSVDDWHLKDQRDSYLSQRAHLRDLGVDQANAFDKAISLLATGALSLSGLFVNSLLARGLQTVHGTSWLFVAWCVLVGALFCNLFSYQTSWHDHQIEIRRLDDAYPDGVPDRKRNWFNRATGMLNIIAAVLLIAGVGLLLVFVALSLP